MNKKLIALIILLSSLVFWNSCVDDDDDYKIDEEWKAYQDGIVAKAASAGSGYNTTISTSGNGNIYWKNITDFVPDRGDENFDRTLSPLFSDSVFVRYQGWYYKQDGDSTIFDTTEGTTGNGRVVHFLTSSLVDGYTTMLQNMTEGEQVQVCIPQKLGYGAYGNNSIPGYTTLWFRIKLLKVKRAGIDF